MKRTLRTADLARVLLSQLFQIDLVPLVLLNQFPVDDPAAEEIRNVNGHIGLASVVVGEQANVVVLPAEKVVDEEHGGVLVVARHVAVVARELDLLARRRAAPGEGLETAITERHFVCVLLLMMLLSLLLFWSGIYV